MKDEIKACLITGIETALDPFMIDRGFTRRKASLIYKRHFLESTQKIDIAVKVHPKDAPNASAAIYPQMEILIPAVDRMLASMIDGSLGLLEGVTGGTSRQPIGFTSEKAHTGRWYIYQPDSIPEIVDEIRYFLDRWTIPLLDAYATPQDVIAVDERNDARLPRDRAQMMRVVAAALVCKRRDYAQTLMDKYLGTVGLRRRYQQVFNYIQKDV